MILSYPPIASETLAVAHVHACLGVNTRNRRIFFQVRTSRVTSRRNAIQLNEVRATRNCNVRESTRA